MNHRDSPSIPAAPLGWGEIPGTAGKAAFSIAKRSPSPIPVMLAVPHAGRAYPRAVLDQMRDPGESAIRLEDRFIDLVAERIAEQTGCGLLVAHAPRAMIDLNRAPADMDWDMLDESRPHGQMPRPGRRARGGLGLVPRRLPGMGEIWKGRLSQADLDARVSGIHTPYHAMLGDELAALRDRWGCALLIDLHSMPPLTARRGAPGHADFVLGDRFGSSCDGILCAAAFNHFSAVGRRAAHNRPYAGGYVLDRHCRPAQGLHGFQLEVCRSAYLDAALREPADTLPELADQLAALVRRLAAEMAELAPPFRLAAE